MLERPGMLEGSGMLEEQGMHFGFGGLRPSFQGDMIDQFLSS